MKLRLAFLLTLVLALAAPSAASALTFKINNESGHSAEDVYVTITGTNFNVPGMADNVPKKLSEVPQPLTINTLHSGRVSSPTAPRSSETKASAPRPASTGPS